MKAEHLTFGLAYIAYTVYLVARSTLPVALPGMIDMYSKEELGAIGSFFALSYGIAKVAAGFLSDLVRSAAVDLQP